MTRFDVEKLIRLKEKAESGELNGAEPKPVYLEAYPVEDHAKVHADILRDFLQKTDMIEYIGIMIKVRPEDRWYGVYAKLRSERDRQLYRNARKSAERKIS